jgi:hypothetical protein
MPAAGGRCPCDRQYRTTASESGRSCSGCADIKLRDRRADATPIALAPASVSSAKLCCVPSRFDDEMAQNTPLGRFCLRGHHDPVGRDDQLVLPHQSPGHGQITPMVGANNAGNGRRPLCARTALTAAMSHQPSSKQRSTLPHRHTPPGLESNSPSLHHSQDGSLPGSRLRRAQGWQIHHATRRLNRKEPTRRD